MKQIFDNIHGFIELSAPARSIIDTQEFQRLRNINQLGLMNYVFPNAIHTRFEHSIGTYYLADKSISGLSVRQPELNLSIKEMECVKIAGLCHDIGHGIFSHFFDNEYLPIFNINTENIHHEVRGKKILDDLISKSPEKFKYFSAYDVDFIKDLIHRTSSKKYEKKYLFQIVANKKCDIDVDKLDYIRRDTYNLGLSYSYHNSRLFDLTKVIGDDICYPQKESYSIAELFHTRYRLHKQIYNHRTTKSVEYMVKDALLLADDELNISNSIHSVGDFLKFNDSILNVIEYLPGLKKSKEILSKLHTRNLYKCVVDKTLSAQISDLDDFVENNGLDLTPNDYIVQQTQIGYSAKYISPLDSVNYYTKNNEKINIKLEDISFLIPKNTSEYIFRIYCKNPEKWSECQKLAEKIITNI